MDNQNLLNEMYQNLQMVLNTMPELTQATSDCDLKGCLEQQEQQFQDFFSRVKQAMTKDMQQPGRNRRNPEKICGMDDQDESHRR